MKARAAVLIEPRRFEMREFDVPDPGDNAAVLRVEACGLCGTDADQYHGKTAEIGLPLPVIPGHEIVGYIHTISESASKRWGVKTGDRVAVEASVPCGSCELCLRGNYLRCTAHIGYGTYITVDQAPYLWGGYAEYLYLHPNTVLHKVSHALSAEEAVLFNPLSNAIRWAAQLPGTQIGDTVVIFGPGQRGILCAVAAHAAGATKIIVGGLSRDQDRLALVREMIGAEIVDVENEDIVQRVQVLTDGHMADIAVDVSANATQPVVDSLDVVKVGGKVVLAGLKSYQSIPHFISDKIVQKEVQILGAWSAGLESVRPAIRMLEAKRYPFELLLTHRFPLEQADLAVRTLAREVEGEEPFHVTILPNG